MRFILSIVFSLITLVSFASFKLSGKIVPSTHTSLAINIPKVYSVYKKENQAIKVQADGSFEVEIPLTEQKFAYLFVNDEKYLLLLKPNKQLYIAINGSENRITQLKGNSEPENQIIQSVDLADIPFFMKSEGNNYPYTKTTPEEVDSIVVKPWLAEQHKRLEIIRQSSLTKDDKALLTAEVKYNTLNHLCDFSSAIVRWKRADWNKFLIQLYDTVSVATPSYARGLQYYLFVERYTKYLFSKALALHDQDSLYKEKPLRYLNISLDSALSLAKSHGETYLAWLAIHHTFDQATAEHFLAQQTLDQYQYGDLTHLNPFFNDFEKFFPHSSYYPELKQYADELRHKLLSNRNNKTTEVFSGYDSVNSIYDVVNKIKGKVIYVDIWGTWCGPCKEELAHVPKLKEKFNGQDLIFVYIDMDEDDKDAEWQDFIRVNNMTGIHLRMTPTQIQSIWQELLPDQKELRGQYPSYFIFDKQGNLVKGKAKRPSDKETLYQQLEKYL